MSTAHATRTATPRAVPARPVRILLPPMTEPPSESPGVAALAAATRVRGIRSPVEDDLQPAPAPRTAERPPAPDPRATVGPLAVAVHEALTGSRPLAQLGRWVTPELYTHLAGLLPSRRTTGPARRTRILSVRVAEPVNHAVEATVVLHDGQRVRAAAVRLAEHRGRWRATDLHIG